MTLSGSTDFTLNGGELVDSSYRLLGVTSTNTTQKTNGYQAVNLILKELEGTGIGIWLNLEVELTLVEDDYDYSLGPSTLSTTDPTPITKPIDIFEVRYVDSDGLETFMSQMSRNEYMAISDKDQSGIPTQYYYDNQFVDGMLYVWPAVSETGAEGTIKFTIRTEINDIDAATNTTHTPKNILRYLKFRTALDLCFEIGAMDRYQYLEREVEKAKIDAFAMDIDNASTFIGVDLG